MSHLVLTGSDLATIQNALNIAKTVCAEHAKCHPQFEAQFKHSAQQYEVLADKLEMADSIEVKVEP